MNLTNHVEQSGRGWQVAVRGLLAGLLLCSIAGLLFIRTAVANSYPDPTRVLVVYKINDVDTDGDGVGDSQELAQYYTTKRNVPPANLLGVNVSVSSSYYSPGQYGLFYSDMVAPIKAKLASLGNENIDIILLAGALPTVVYDGSNAGLSVDNALMGINVLGSASNSVIPNAPNPYFSANPGFSTNVGHFNHASFMYMGTDMYLVARLGSTSSLRGIDQVAQSVYADLYVYPQPGYYYGTAYVDSQWGMPNGQSYTDAYLSSQMAVQTGDYSTQANADMNIAYAEHWVTAAAFPLKWENTTNALRIGDPGAIFSDGTNALSAPRALFYGGWYNFDNYNNVYQWLPGSVACDLNSAPYFATQALQHGASAAAYVVSEPYLNGHQRPNILYYYILHGYDFAEASALATPFIGWMAVNEGDPLYAPTQPKNPVIDTLAPVLKAGYPQLTINAAAASATVSLPIDDSQAPEVVTATVKYGPDTNYGSVANSAPGFSRAPSALLPFTPGVTFHYQVTLTDPVGNVWTSGDFTYVGNAPPTIASPASATPNPVTGRSAAMAVLGADQGGESNLSYTWSATGPAAVTFNTNGSNASKNSTATFAKAGIYSLQVVVKNSVGNTVTSSCNVTVSQTPSQLAVGPASTSVSINGTQQFTATVNDQFGNAIAQAPVTWSVTGGGVISSSGLFTASGVAGGPFTVSATSGSLSGASSVTLIANTTPPTGAAGYWNFDEGSGTIANDTAGSGYNGTISGATWTAGKVNSGLSFSGTTSDVVTPGIPLSNAFSISAWVNPAVTTQTPYGRITETRYYTGLYLGVDGSGKKYQFIVNNGLGATGSCGVAYGCAVGGTISSGWHLVTGTYDGATARLYIDTTLVASETFTAPPNTNYPLYIGRYYASNGFGWNGVLDEVRLYNRAITSAEVSSIYSYAGTSDTTPPTTPANVSATAISSTQINISWSASTDNVGVTGYSVFRNGSLAATTTALSYADTGLAQSTTFAYTVAAFDAAGNVSPQSSPVGATTFTPDTTPPTVSITAPTAGAMVSNTLTVSANAGDNVAVADVQFYLDGTALGPDLTSTAYSISWDTTKTSNGSHTLTAIARDTSQNSTTSTAVVVTVSNTPTQGAIGYWNFDEGSGTIANDTSGSGYNGTISGATWTAGKINSGLSFNGTTSDVVTPGIPLSNAFSISAWVNPAVTTQTPYGRITETRYYTGLYLGVDGSGKKYQFIVNNGLGATGSCGVAYGCAVGGTISSGWHLVTGTYDGATARLYVDTTLVASETFTAPPNTNYPLYIGRYYASNGFGWNGVLDDVRLYNRAITSAEVSSIYSYAGTSDTTPPTTPANVSATAVSSTQINISWSASTDNVGVTGYSVFRNGSLAATTAALSYADTGLAQSTTFAYTVAAFDAAGNVSPRSSPVGATTFTPDTTPPTVSITAPTAGAMVSNTLTVSANASDNVAVADVQFYLDGTALGPDLTSTAYSISWDTTKTSNGSHTLTAIARDTSQNSTTSTAVGVTVSNTGVLPPTQGLIGYWNFDEGSGTIANDTSGSGYNGTISGAIWTAGKINSGLSFSGTTSDVVTPGIPLGNTFSVSAWVNPAVTTQALYGRIAETQYNTGLYLGVDGSGKKYQFIVNNGIGATGSCGVVYGCAVGGTISSGWHLVTGTYDGATARLYVDTTLVASETFTAPLNTNYPLYIGRYYASNGHGWNGVLDEVRLYNRAITATEVGNIYNYSGTP